MKKMQFNQKTSILKLLIDLDFLIIKMWTSNISKRSISCYSTNVFNTIHLFDLFELNKEIKQFLKLLLSFKDLKTAIIYLVFESISLYEIWLLLLKNSKLKCTLILSTFFPSYKNKKLSIYLFYFGTVQKLSLTVINLLLSNNIFLIEHFNLSLEKNKYGVYKIYHDFGDLKKKLFLSLLIKRCLK
jgi:hypothetical protein